MQSKNQKNIRVFIADDHAVVRRGLKQILSEESDIEIIGEASNDAETIDGVFEFEPDVLVLDITMPGKSGLDILADLRRKKPQLKVLILSMHPEEEIAIRALKSGAMGYINKQSIPGELIKAIRKVHSGAKYISSSLAESIALSLDRDMSRESHEYLSDREFQVLCHIASGSSLSQIAEALNLSVKTVSTYRTRILEKMNMKSNVELTHYALKHNLVL